MTYILIPLVILLALVLLLGIFILLSRFRGGRYLRPIIRVVSKVGFIRRWITKASTAALERENPPLASAMRKAELFGTPTTPQQVQKLDSIDSISALRQVGKAVAERKVEDAHLNFEVFRP